MPVPVTLLAFEACDLLDIGGPYEVLLTANRIAVREGGAEPFAVTVTTEDGRPVRCFGGVGLLPGAAATDVEDVGILVVPGLIDVDTGLADERLRSTVTELAGRARIVTSVCTGAFLLAAGGLLTGRPATTHHEDVAALGARPDVGSVPLVPSGDRPRWIDDGDVVTAAGLSSGIAMALHLVARFAGAELAGRTARQIEYEWSDDDGLTTPHAAAPRGGGTAPTGADPSWEEPMSDERWTAVDEYFAELLVPADEALEAAREASTAAGLPAIAVSPAQGKLLHLLALTAGARTVLEIGTLGGYSTIWLARALPADGRVVSLEADDHHAAVARDNVARAGLADLVEIRVGRALDTLPELHDEDPEPFDLVFIDADKANIPGYFEWALRLTRPGSLIVVDNVVRGGAVADADHDDPDVQGVRRFAEQLAAEERATGTVIQTVGAKGYDGFALVIVAAQD